VVLDDAVVHHGQIIAGEMRVGVALARRAVGGPAGVRDAQTTGQLRLGLRLFQLGDLAGAAQALQFRRHPARRRRHCRSRGIPGA